MYVLESKALELYYPAKYIQYYWHKMLVQAGFHFQKLTTLKLMQSVSVCVPQRLKYTQTSRL